MVQPGLRPAPPPVTDSWLDAATPVLVDHNEKKQMKGMAANRVAIRPDGGLLMHTVQSGGSLNAQRRNQHIMLNLVEQLAYPMGTMAFACLQPPPAFGGAGGGAQMEGAER